MPTAGARKIEAIDLFCGIGGLTFGLRQAGIDVKAGLDNDASCEYAYEKNNRAKFITADVSNYDFNELKKYYSKDSIKVLVGCAPCQTFSAHTQKIREREKDLRWNLIDYFIEAINVLKPDIVSMENVRGITKTDIFNKFVNQLKELGFEVNHKVVYCPDYGIAQNRSRLVLLASRFSKIEIPEKTHSEKKYVTVQEAIGKLPRIRAGGMDPQDKFHYSSGLTPINIERIKQSKPGGTWKDWDKKLLPTCYKKETGKSYMSIYGRMSWKDVAPTITTQFYNYGSGRFGHPKQNRALSIREGAIIQSFPLTYDFGESKSLTEVARHIGNAVPPRLGYVIGKAIKNHLLNKYA